MGRPRMAAVRAMVRCWASTLMARVLWSFIVLAASMTGPIQKADCSCRATHFMGPPLAAVIRETARYSLSTPMAQILGTCTVFQQSPAQPIVTELIQLPD